MKNNIRTIGIVLVMAVFSVFLFGQSPVHAQALLGLEGPIQRVIPATNEMIVMGARVVVPPGTPITTPVATLPGLGALVGAPLPGRGTTPGFIGGTAIINGRISAAGVMTATDVFVEPAENVMIGTVTASTCINATCSGPGNVLEVNGARMVPIRDPRLAAGPVTNQFGFEVDLTGQNLVGRAAETEGYFAGGRFNYFLLSIARAPLANAGAEVSIQRAQCRDNAGGIQLDVLGSVHPRAGVITITDGGATVFGTVRAIAAGPGFGAYTFRLRDNPAFGRCPTSVTAEFRTGTATADVDIIP